MEELAKRTAGALLSDAERQQRRLAARARWSGVIGATTGAAAVATLLRPVAQLVADRARRAHKETVRPVMRAEKRIETRAAVREMRAQELVADPKIWPVPFQRLALRREIRAARKDILTLPKHYDEFLQREVPSSLALVHVNVAQEKLERLNDARPPGEAKVRSGGAVKGAKAHTRTLSVKTDRLTRHGERMKAELSTGAVNEPDEVDQRLGLHPSPEGKQPAYPKGWYAIDKRAFQVKEGRAIARKDARLPDKGNPGPADIRRMRRNLGERIKHYFGEKALDREAERVANLVPAREAFRAQAAPRLLAMMRGRGLKGLGVAVGALGGYFAARSIGEKLQKADSDTDNGTTLLHHGLSAEAEMSDRLARMFRSWKEITANTLLDPKPTKVLRDKVSADLVHATEPIDAAMRAGASTPIPVDFGDGGRGDKILAMTIGARSPTVQAYIEAYRQNKVAELRQEQMEALTDILINAAKSGASPDFMARQIKQTIGLTANQMQQVLNYRAELERGDPAALERQLRDKRYDRTITRSFLDAGDKLTPDQIDKMVNAYHRKYLAYRAMTIARTEGVGAANNGHAAAVQEVLDNAPGMTVIKTWMATADDRTRPDHVALHGQQVIGFETPFIAESGDEIIWPHHPDAAARQVVACRCTFSTKLVPAATARRFLSDNPQLAGVANEQP